jgi:hypothetical protein
MADSDGYVTLTETGLITYRRLASAALAAAVGTLGVGE